MSSDTAIIPADLRQRLEVARLDNLALMRVYWFPVNRTAVGWT
jgi:hypothetical protein